MIGEIKSEFKIMIDKEKPLPGGEIRYRLDKEFIRRLSDIKVTDLFIRNNQLALWKANVI